MTQVLPDLADIGILSLEAETVFTRDVEIVNDLIADKTLTAQQNVVIGGNLVLMETRTGDHEQSYVLEGVIEDLSAGDGIYMIAPTGGDGYISAIRVVLLSALSGGAAVLDSTVDGNAIPATEDIDVANGSPGDVSVNNGSFTAATTNNDVNEGSVIRVYPSTPGGSAARLSVQVEIIRT